MKTTCRRSVIALLLVLPAVAQAADQRNIITGRRIPDEGYCDQPYVVVTKSGHWLCTLTTGAGKEGQTGQHVVSTISKDQGKTWSPLVDIERADGPAASWVVPLATPGGRVYAIYTYNGDKVHLGRDDVHGHYAMKYSDDEGRSWSKQRYRIPIRITACDTLKKDGKVVQMFWGIDKPKTAGGTVYFAFTKLGEYFLQQGEGWLFASDNILTAKDPNEIHWDLRPAGDHGIRKAEYGSIQEEHNLVPLGEGRLYCVYRTTKGFPCHAYSKDGGRTWTEPEPMVFAPGGRIVKQNRACPKLWRCANGKFLFWFHLHGGRDYSGRNPAWIIGGVLKSGKLHWSQPEILLYDDNPNVRMSYPDLIEQDGKYWVTETQKTVARIHPVDRTLLEGLWSQLEQRDPAEPVRNGRIADFSGSDLAGGSAAVGKPLSASTGKGFTVEMWLTAERFTPGRALLDARAGDGSGWAVTVGKNNSLTLSIHDGKHGGSWDLDANLLKAGRQHHVVFVVDGGPKIITAIVDGTLCDGGRSRKFGWGRFDAKTGDVSGSGVIKTETTDVKIHRLRIYDRYLRTAEAVTNFRAGP